MTASGLVPFVVEVVLMYAAPPTRASAVAAAATGSPNPRVVVGAVSAGKVGAKKEVRHECTSRMRVLCRNVERANPKERLAGEAVGRVIETGLSRE